MVSIHTRLGIGGEQDRPNVFHTRWVGGHKLFPKRAFARLLEEDINLRGQLSRLVDIQRPAIRAPRNWLFAGLKSVHWTRIAALHRIQISLLVRTDSCHELRVRRNHECVPMYALWRDRGRL